ncbi:hypothetical protein [Kitasatospora cineracea]|uniref:hypothetical protein n=1 Tax=Kitasatospora cineracea TaxID=88074 RepID=UPI0033E6B52D
MFEYGDRVFERPDEDEDDDWLAPGESFLALRPAVCDGHGAAWRLAMVQAVENLRDDLRSGRAPSATCTAEELALHLIVDQAKELLDWLDDEECAAEFGLPTAEGIGVRHRAFGLYLETYLQDFDVLMHYDAEVQHVAQDPEHPVSQQLGTGDLRPRAWFAPFGNVRPRPPRPVPAWVLERLATADPAAFVTGPAPAAEPATGQGPGGGLPDGLREEFETLVGLAQRRFFDEPCAVAMAGCLERLLTALFDTPSVVPGRIWPLRGRAYVPEAGWLLVDQDFQLRGLTETWRLRADRAGQEARDWAVDLLADCANYALAHYRHQEFALGGTPDTPTLPPLDPALPEVLEQRLNALAECRTVTAALHHLTTRLDLSTGQLAQAAVLPEPLVAAWLDGREELSPSQLIRCAPVLQVSEDDLLDTLAGKRDPEFWPLPQPPADRPGRPGTPD